MSTTQFRFSSSNRARACTLLLLLLLLLPACRRVQRESFAAVPARLEAIRGAEFVPSLTLLGVVRSARTIPIAAAQSGTLIYSQRFASGLQTGAHVRRGEVLATVHNDQLHFDRTQARLQMEAADASFETARKSYEQGLTSGAEYQQRRLAAELARNANAAAERASAQLTISAPESGALVVAKPLAPGVFVSTGAVLGEIASEGAPIIEASVAAGERASLRPGLGATAGELRARIAEVAAVIDANGTARVVAAVEGGAVPLPGTGVELHVELDRRHDVLTVPEEAIVAANDGPAVFVASGTASGNSAFWRVRRVSVVLGARGSGRVEVLSGLREGDRVVVTGADALTDGSVVTDAAEESR
jgi:RND family efflux transporter MFP subunit